MEQAVANKYIDQHDQKVVLTIKYKIYIVILILVMAISWGYMRASADKYETTKTTISKLENQKLQKEAEYNETVSDLIVVKNITEQK